MNFEFNNFTPQLVVQLFLVLLSLKKIANLFTRDLYNTIFSSCCYFTSYTKSSWRKNSIEEFEFALYSLEKFIN